MPISRVLLFALFFLAGCQQKGWIYKEVISDSPQFSSTCLRSCIQDPFNGIEIEFLKGEFGIVGFLNVLSRLIVSDQIVIYVNGTRHDFNGILMNGLQRMRLPDAASHLIVENLLAGNCISIYLEGYLTEIYPLNFHKKWPLFIGKSTLRR